MLKLGITLLAWLLHLAVLIEARDSEPRSISTGLTGLRVEASSKGVVAGQHSTIDLQIILGNAAFIHPQAKVLVADELDDTDGLVNRSILCVTGVDLILVGQHPLLSFQAS